MYNYLIIIKEDNEHFLTNYFDPKNHFQLGMTVYNLYSGTFTTDGINWSEVPEDSL